VLQCVAVCCSVLQCVAYERVLSQVQYIVGVEGAIDRIEMKRLDKFGFDVRVTKGDDSGNV